MTQSNEEQLKNALAQFTTEEQAMMKEFATLKIENKIITDQLDKLQGEYDSLWRILITLLDGCPDKELRIHSTQFLRFKAEYRIDRQMEGDEVVLRLLTLADKNETK